MFPAPDSPEMKQLKSHVAMFAALVVVIRVTPYILRFFSDQKEELALDS